VIIIFEGKVVLDIRFKLDAKVRGKGLVRGGGGG
jgi:hypothetical protein